VDVDGELMLTFPMAIRVKDEGTGDAATLSGSIIYAGEPNRARAAATEPPRHRLDEAEGGWGGHSIFFARSNMYYGLYAKT
jgi:hypothetical protein